MKRLCLLALIWGWSFLFIKVAVEGMTPTAVAGARVALGAAVLVAILRRRRLALPRSSVMWRHFTVAALVGNVLPFTMLAWGEERITSALTAVLNASTPMFTAVAAAVYLGDRLRRPQVAGLGLGLVGVAVASGVGGADLAGSDLAGSMASVLAGACYGLAFAYMRRHLIGVPPLVAAGGQLVAATVMLAPFAVATSVVHGVDVTATRALSVVALGVLGTGLAYVLNYRVIADLGATRASLVTYVIPIVAVAVGIAVLGEPFAPRAVIGGVLIVAGIAAVHQRLGGRARVPLGPTAAAAVVLVALIAIPACTTDGAGEGSSGCGPARREALDPAFLQHVLPGSPEPEYVSDPPTSGPHQPGRPFSGAVDEPMSRPVQVGLLEAGDVLIQHREPLPADQVEALVAIDERVVVAPNPDLPDPIVATAWLFKLTCDEVDPDALARFVEERAGRGPGTDG